ncbi:helix-turn-helix transcriptional regulator [Candidatus Obscuribacterales bacterium]|nr:helix-turn-helix transcriptional regulator [Candidatus Obscuribacterales bacterium]
MSVLLTWRFRPTIIRRMLIDQISLYKFIGKRLQKKRASLGMTQSELAVKVDLSRTSIANIEAGNQNAPLHVIYEIGLTLGLKPSELFPSFEEITSPLEVGDAIAQKMAGAGSDKAANVVRSLVRSTREEFASGIITDVQKQGGKRSGNSMGKRRKTNSG